MRFMQKYVGHPFRKERTIGILKYSYSLLDSDILEFIHSMPPNLLIVRMREGNTFEETLKWQDRVKIVPTVHRLCYNV